jgi:hypothetical protein
MNLDIKTKMSKCMTNAFFFNRKKSITIDMVANYGFGV